MSQPVALPADTPVRQAAQAMRDKDIGDVLVLDGDRLAGIVTDRDIVIRAVAGQDNLADCRLRDVCSSQVVTVSPDEDADTAISRMARNAVRRIPVVDNGRPIGVLSLGDAAIEHDPNSVLSEISAAEGDR
ncbi:CBS domain-containing protein [Amycolatopsis sp. WAC 01376]|uniref:CBS domain-containing protein n=1 Tax=Amycolatopsis sp. WAC 01376 TaxID=2203195 RepID=UPI001F3E98D3|nr:CBS domain-containing protein [Amycolatopsis sp. WAC 01376]